MKNAIKQMKYLGGNTNTAAGINLMHHTEFTVQNGDRPHVPNIAIIVTDGNSTRDKANTIPYAEAARRADIEIYTVGITDRINVVELRKMASMPEKENENYYVAKNFNSLTTVADNLVSYACRAKGKNNAPGSTHTPNLGLTFPHLLCAPE